MPRAWALVPALALGCLAAAVWASGRNTALFQGLNAAASGLPAVLWAMLSVCGSVLGAIALLAPTLKTQPRWLASDFLAAPLAMLFIGIAMSKTRWEEIAVGKELVVAMLGRYLICPWIVFLILPFFHLEPMMEKVFVIMAAMPAMTNTAIVAKGYGGDYKYAAMLTAVSTVLAVFAIPFYMWLVH